MRLLLIVLLGLGVGTASAQSLTVDGITVHYSAIPTLDLDPAVARGYAIIRSENRALLNIAVRRKDGDTDRALGARIVGSAQNDAGQPQALTLREVREGDAIYYLAEPRLRPGDTLRFDLVVIPEGASQPIEVRFSRAFPP